MKEPIFPSVVKACSRENKQFDIAMILGENKDLVTNIILSKYIRDGCGYGSTRLLIEDVIDAEMEGRPYESGLYDKLYQENTCENLKKLKLEGESLKKENVKLFVKVICYKCAKKKANLVCFPCGHRTICEKCAKEELSLCPYCDSHVTHNLLVYSA